MQPGPALLLPVVANGSGLEAETLERPWEPFFSTKPPHKGCRGMGLPMVQEIVAEHAGTVYIDTQYRSGCRMIVELPFSSAN